MVHTQYSEQDMPIQDDGWWASVLAEEESRRVVLRLVKPKKPKRQENLRTDWGKAGRFIVRMKLFSMSVTGFNRGGLLVEGEGLNGFVPCSHLVDLPFQA